MTTLRWTYVLRHLLSVLALPTVVAVIVPLWITRRYGVVLAWPVTLAGVAMVVAGATVFAIGLLLFAGSLRGFFVEGQGTLAPWDPPRRLVVQGLYRYVRNPMIAGVIFILAGLALMLRSIPHGVWAAAFVAINAIYIPLTEEPMLEHRFGEDYREYCRHVRRFVPRRRPWGN
jgi:protein-S-isoprenylcysteine O-methyltransferase Ste14